MFVPFFAFFVSEDGDGEVIMVAGAIPLVLGGEVAKCKS